MSSNLPPGVNESDLPGNRVEDGYYDQILDALPADISEFVSQGSAKTIGWTTLHTFADRMAWKCVEGELTIEEAASEIEKQYYKQYLI